MTSFFAGLFDSRDRPILDVNECPERRRPVPVSRLRQELAGLVQPAAAHHDAHDERHRFLGQAGPLRQESLHPTGSGAFKLFSTFTMIYGKMSRGLALARIWGLF